MTTVPTNTWRKSSRSQNVSNCVEVSNQVSTWAVRDTKARAAGIIETTPAAWAAFLTTLR